MYSGGGTAVLFVLVVRTQRAVVDDGGVVRLLAFVTWLGELEAVDGSTTGVRAEPGAALSLVGVLLT